MRRTVDAIRQFLRSAAGPTAVEYAVLISLVLLTCIAGVQSVGATLGTPLQEVEGSLEWPGSNITYRRDQRLKTHPRTNAVEASSKHENGAAVPSQLGPPYSRMPARSNQHRHSGEGYEVTSL